jgi:hypothetical protein
VKTITRYASARSQAHPVLQVSKSLLQTALLSTPACFRPGQELAAGGEVAGELRGGGSTWVPAVHARAQQEAVLAFFRSGPGIDIAV